MKKIIILITLGALVVACSSQSNVVNKSIVQDNAVTKTDTTIDIVVTNNESIVRALPNKVVHSCDTNSAEENQIKEIKRDSIDEHNKKTLIYSYAHVDMSTVITNMVEYTEVLHHMDSLRKYLVNEYGMMVAEFQKKETEFNADTTSLEVIRQMKQQELQSLAERIKYFQETSQRQLTEEENKLMMPVIKKMRRAIADVSNELNLIAVFDDTYLLYSSADALDITEEVLRRLK